MLYGITIFVLFYATYYIKIIIFLLQKNYEWSKAFLKNTMSAYMMQLPYYVYVYIYNCGIKGTAIKYNVSTINKVHNH